MIDWAGGGGQIHGMARKIRKTRPLLWFSALVTTGLLPAAGLALAGAEFHPGEIWNDTAGNPIQAHGGGVLVHSNVFYWYGEDRTPGMRGGVSCYSSTNLYDWKREGDALPREALPRVDGQPTFLERPKVIFNPRTGKFVMWMHLEQRGYRFASAGVAVGDRPTGPFTFTNAFQPNGNMSRDMTVFLDDDGKAYEIYAARDNYDMRICRLSDDFLSATTNDVMIASDHREAPALFKYRARYYLITSACTGWTPNAANYYTADHIPGPWTAHPNPCRGPNAEKTFGGQSTFVLAAPGKPGGFIFMADRWKPRDLANSAYLWLPLQIKGDDLSIGWQEAWSLDGFDKARNTEGQRNGTAPKPAGRIAPRPLYRDPPFDAPTDPVLCFNAEQNKWFMYYTARRATATNAPGVTWVHGSNIGMAESGDGGATWTYRGTADIRYGKEAHPNDYTYWAPEVIWVKGTYHMYLTYVPGIFTDWNHPREIVHLTSQVGVKWETVAKVELQSDRTIDPCVMQIPNGTWRMWYKDERQAKPLSYADSPDLYQWEPKGNAVSEFSGEGPKVFHWQNKYWLIADCWRNGMRVWSSDDCTEWKLQDETLVGSHGDVVVSGGRAWWFYFGGPQFAGGPRQRTTAINVLELSVVDGKLLHGDPDQPTYMDLKLEREEER